MRIWWLIGTLVLLLTGCAHGPRVLRLDAQELSARLAQELPLDRRLLEVFDVRVSEPRVRTDPDNRRVRADFQVRIHDRLGGRSFDTQLAVLSGLRWEPRDRTLRMERVDLDLPPRTDRDEALLQRVGLALASRLLEDRVLWRAPDDRPVEVQLVTVTATGLELRLAP